MTDLPAPLVPADVDLRNFPFIPLVVAQLKQSKQWLRCKRKPALAFYCINLWLAAWHEVPAGSLEDDDEVLADRAMCAGAKLWASVRGEVMRGWIKCADGRLYHPVVCAKAIESWQGKLGYRDRLEKARAAKRAKQNQRDADLSQINDRPVTGLKGEGEGDREGEGQGDREGEGESSLLSVEAPCGAETGEELPFSPIAEPKRKATRLPQDWTLTDDLRRIASDARAKHGLAAINLDLEADKFAGFWHSKSGKDATKIDWRSTWRNWALNATPPRGSPARDGFSTTSLLRGYLNGDERSGGPGRADDRQDRGALPAAEADRHRG